ncbi:MAG: MBL fold metallo-hydrolase [Mycoplasmoidaceae bacterium]|nr:MAG: MBL fold metallo-hydrolase [Mycoplasmoidaceae bacterium]
MELTHGIISLDSALKSHIYIIPVKDGYVLIDTGWCCTISESIKEIKSLKIDFNKIKMILLTHCDLDHIGGCFEISKLTNCPIYASKKEIKKCYNKKRSVNSKKLSYEIFGNENGIDSYPEYDTNKLIPLPKNRIGDFTIVNAPGHSYKMKCFIYKDVLFAGDLIMTRKGVIESNPECSNMNNKSYYKTLKNFDMSKINLICQSHGKPIEAHPAWETFIKTLKI